ncbi:MAG TPA: hypothetical protein VGD67_11760 [Pseudonocardiaceae bacterium]
MALSERTRRELEAARAKFEGTLAANRELVRETRREIAELAERARREKAEERIDEKFQEAARSGAAGPDMKRIQEQVDRGKLTWDDVFTGRADPAYTSVVRRATVGLQRAVELGRLEAPEPPPGGRHR